MRRFTNQKNRIRAVPRGKNMINKINKERRRSMNATPTFISKNVRESDRWSYKKEQLAERLENGYENIY
jgi:hypothetical protein